MKLIQMNVWGWRLFYPMRRFLAAEQPDFLTVQESVMSPAHICPDHDSPAALLKENLVSACVHSDGIPFGRSHCGEKRLGVGILSRHGLEAGEGLDLFAPEVVAAKPSLSYYRLMHATAELGGRQLHLLTYHGRLQVDKSQWHEGRLGGDAAQPQFEAIGRYVDRLDGPVILAGDFNLWPSAPALAPLGERLTNLVKPQHMLEGRNAMAWKADEIVNHIFVSPEVKVEDFTVSRAMVSDHQPLVLNFTL